MTTDDSISGDVANGVLRRMLDESPLTEKQAERIFKSRFREADAEAIAPEVKRYRSSSHRPDAACVAKTQKEAREFFRKLMGVDKLPDNFRLERF